MGVASAGITAGHGSTTAYRRGCRCASCRAAKAAAAAAYHAANAEKERARWRAYRLAHQAGRRVQNRAEWAVHGAEIRARLDAHDAAHPERRRERDRRRRARQRAGRPGGLLRTGVPRCTTLAGVHVLPGLTSGQLLTVEQVAAALGVHPVTVRRAIQAGRLRAGRTAPTAPYRIDVKAVEGWLAKGGHR